MRGQRGVDRMRAYQIGLFLIIFNLGIPVFVSLDIFTVPIEQGAGMFSVSMGELTKGIFSSFLMSGVGILSVLTGVVLSIVGFRIPIGALVYGAVFTVSSFPLGNLLNQFVNAGYLMSSMATLISGVVAFIFIWGFIDVAS